MGAFLSARLSSLLPLLTRDVRSLDLVEHLKGHVKDIPFKEDMEISVKGMTLALTGSRYFEKLEGEQDWDFFTEYEDSTIEYLVKEGFTKIYGGTIYDDVDVLEVYRFREGNLQIDIQIVKDYPRRLIIRNLLKSIKLPWGSIGKDVRSKLWDVAYTLSMLPSPIPSINTTDSLVREADLKEEEVWM